ncbi:MAG: hypothetical protein KC486_33655, partial [Myxococcales bacterium]|nr:hypothetical protein [Myxococcales bacterium]
GEVRLYGVTMERELPGVVWDGMAQIGAFTNRMLEFDAAHLKAQLDHREADLAVFMFGGNDMIRKIKMSTYEGEYREVIKHVKGARPEMDCLVMAPLDHGVRDGARIMSKPVVERMVKAQRAAAEAEGCAFFDTWTAMGGDGSAGRWFKRKPRLMGGDLGHATGKGHQVIGELFYRALLAAYIDYRKRTDKDAADAGAADKGAAERDAAAKEPAGEGVAETDTASDPAETNAAASDGAAAPASAGEREAPATVESGANP